jgi:hypothetical protein
MESVNRRQQHSYRLSYATEVGSSFDPNLEDADAWERELAGKIDTSAFIHSSKAEYFCLTSEASTRTPTRARVSPPQSIPPVSTEQIEEFTTPFDLDEAELEEYAEEYARMTALADFEDIPVQELFAWSDDFLDETAHSGNEQDTMDVS